MSNRLPCINCLILPICRNRLPDLECVGLVGILGLGCELMENFLYPSDTQLILTNYLEAHDYLKYGEYKNE